LLYGVDDFDVARAPAEISRDGFFDFVARRPWGFIEQRARSDQHSGSADATLRAAAFEKSLLKRI
jgi:hypothetical protein